jgi:hypothetical protein
MNTHNNNDSWKTSNMASAGTEVMITHPHYKLKYVEVHLNNPFILPRLGRLALNYSIDDRCPMIIRCVLEVYAKSMPRRSRPWPLEELAYYPQHDTVYLRSRKS